MGPRLILTLIVFIEHDQVAFEPLPNLLLDLVRAVRAAFEEALLEDGSPVFGFFVRRLAAFGLDLVLVSTCL